MGPSWFLDPPYILNPEVAAIERVGLATAARFISATSPQIRSCFAGYHFTGDARSGCSLVTDHSSRLVCAAGMPLRTVQTLHSKYPRFGGDLSTKPEPPLLAPRAGYTIHYKPLNYGQTWAPRLWSTQSEHGKQFQNPVTHSASL